MHTGSAPVKLLLGPGKKFCCLVVCEKLERVHSSCLRSILGVRLSDRHTNEHIRKSCGVATLSAYITANRLRWLGHVGRMEEGRLPHIALFSS